MAKHAENYTSCQSHCCAMHGCKYNLDGCPVVSGELRQSKPCETCGFWQLKVPSASEIVWGNNFLGYKDLSIRDIPNVLERARQRVGLSSAELAGQLDQHRKFTNSKLDGVRKDSQLELAALEYVRWLRHHMFKG